MILILSLGVLTSRTAFATSHISVIPNTAESILGKYPHVQKNHNCKNLYPHQFDIFWSCLLSKNKLASIALIVDSHANQYFTSLSKVVGDESLISLAEPACLPFSSDPFYKVQNCKIKALALEKFIVENPSIGTYVIAGNFGFLESAEFLQNSENNRFTNVRVSGEVSNSDKATYIENYSRFFELLLKWNKIVILVRDIPSLGVNPQSCLALDPSYLSKLRLSPLQDNSVVRKDSSDCWIDSKSFIERDKYNRLSVDEMLKRFPEVYSFDSVPLICSVPHKCFIVRKGIPLYFNSDHLSIDGADLIMTEFVKLFKINSIKPD
jgi:hypothetical protein